MNHRARAVGVVIALSFNAFGCSSTREHDDATRTLEGELGMNDVSILYPLPASGHLDELLSPSSKSARGELLPMTEVERVADLVPGYDAESLYRALRVVSVRIDPCFPSLTVAPSATCRFQVRLVLQPVVDDAGQVYAEDAALHLFYDLPVGDFVTLVGTLVDAQSVPPTAPLDVHPALEVEGLTGPYAKRLESALLSVIGKQRLTRMTFSKLGVGRTSFTFGGFDYLDGEAEPLAILSTAVVEQTFTNDTMGDPLAFSGAVSPRLEKTPEDLSPLYDSTAAKTFGDEALWPLYESVLRIENPNHHSAASVDCVSCHTAQPARLWLDRNTALASRPSEYRYESVLDLGVTQAVGDTTSALRAFGWLGDRPAISARTVNESAAVTSYLNEQLLR